MSTRFTRNLIFAVITTAAAVYLFGNDSVPLWDRDEPRYAQTSHQMLDSGDWVVPHYLKLVRTAKPAMIYWCQAASMRIFGVGSFAARFPSSASIVILLIILAIVLWRWVDPVRAAWTVFVLATAALTIASAKMCITDALLLLWVTISQLCLYSAWRRRASWPVVIIWAIAAGFAGLTKGPVVLGMQVTTLIALGVIRLVDRYFSPSPGTPAFGSEAPARRGEGRGKGDFEQRKTLEVQRNPHPNPLLFEPEPQSRTPGYWERGPRAAFLKTAVWLLIVTAVVLPWVLLVMHRATQFNKDVIHHEIWDRMLTPLEQHSGPPGYYFLAIWGTFFPWSLLLPLAVASAFVRRADPRLRFALAAVLGPWIMLECFRTKLPFYFLPALPPLAFMVADAIARTIKGELNDLRRMPFIAVIDWWSITVIVLSLFPWWIAYRHWYAPIPVILLLNLIAISFAAFVWRSFHARRVERGLVGLGFGTLLMLACFYGLYLPGAQPLQTSKRVAKVLIDHGVTNKDQVLMIGYAEPSLAFYQGGTIGEGGNIGFVRVSAQAFTPWLVVPRSLYDPAPPDLKAPYEIVDAVRGWDYADRGKWVDVLILHKK